MSKDRIDVSDNTSISMPVRNMLAIIAAVAVGAWAYFGVLERITMLETKSVLTEKDLEQHVERLEADLTKNNKKTNNLFIVIPFSTIYIISISKL